MNWNWNDYIFWGVQLPSAIVLWSCAICVSLVFLKATLMTVFKKRGGNNENK